MKTKGRYIIKKQNSDRFAALSHLDNKVKVNNILFFPEGKQKRLINPTFFNQIQSVWHVSWLQHPSVVDFG